MPQSDLVEGFRRVADGDPEAPPVDDLLADLQSSTERGVAAVEAIHDQATADASTLDPDTDADEYVDVVERVEDVGYLVDRVHDQVALVGDLVAARTDAATHGATEGAAGRGAQSDPQTIAQHVVDFASDGDDDRLPSKVAERYRDAVLDGE